MKRIARRLTRRAKSWGTIVALTLGGNKIEKRANLYRCKNPVLLLYGFGATRRTFSILEKRLHLDGYTVFSLNLGGLGGTFNTDPIEQLASYVDEKIERLYKKYDFRGKLSIISHSKGGLIGHYYIKRLGGDQRVRMLITLGTPHNGNPWAQVASLTPLTFILRSVRQMAPSSPFIRRLKQGPFPKKVKLYSLFSRDDRVCPYPVAMLPDAPNVKNVEIDSVTHSEFLIKKTVYYIIKHALDDAMPTSLEERTREKHNRFEQAAKVKRKLRLIEGAKSLALKKIS